MARFFLRKAASKAGLPPGTLVQLEGPDQKPSRLSVFTYDAEAYSEEHPDSVPALQQLPSSEGRVRWINLDGVHDTQAVARLGQQWDIHPLALEDIANSGQRPKMEAYGDQLFVVAQMLRLDGPDSVVHEQVSFVLMPGVLLTFQEAPGDVFETIRERIREDQGRVRHMGADYLLYALLDAIVDHYFVVLERLFAASEELEESVLNQPVPGTLSRIHELKSQAVFLRKLCWRTRDLVSSLRRRESDLFTDETGVYLRDLHDHSIQLVDTLEVFRESVSGLMEVYLSAASNRMNEVMKVLTMIATIFIPLTFIAGIYGMNLHMPETQYWITYPIVMVIMAALAGMMVWYFKRKRWL